MIQDADALLELCRTTMNEDPDHPDLQELEEKFYKMERAESRVRLAQFDSEPFLILVSGFIGEQEASVPKISDVSGVSYINLIYCRG